MLLHVADYMISFMWQSCCGERAGSHINLTKTKSRTGLREDTFHSLIFKTFNMPNLHEMDFAAFVIMWAKERHRMGTAKECMQSEYLSKVVCRLLTTKTGTFFLQKCGLKNLTDIGAVKLKGIERRIELAFNCI
jgi:hypothetical protein